MIFRWGLVPVDGLDASQVLATMLHSLSFDAIMLAGVSFAWFNIVDPTAIFEKFRKPIIIISRTKPDNLAVKNALIRHLEDWPVRWAIFEKLGEVHRIVSMRNEPPLSVEFVGTTLAWTRKVIRSLACCCRIPEPIRVARLIAHGLTQGGQQS